MMHWMKMKPLVVSVVAGIVAAILQVTPAAGAPLSWPNGPWLQPNQEVSIASIRDYDQLVATLENIVASSQGASVLRFALFPAKGSGRLVPYVTIGNGPRGMVVIANQHGDEYVVSNGALDLIRALSSNAKEARFIRDELTIIIVPRVNIDGFDATTTGSPWRQNFDPNVCPSPTPCPAFYTRNRGYDINRYHPYLTLYPRDNPNTPGPDENNPVPEALNVRYLYDEAGGAGAVEVVIDLHHQSTPLDENRDLVTGSTLWPTAAGVTAQVVFRSKQVVSRLLIAMDKIAHANFSRYVGGPEPGISRNAYGLLGSVSILMEHRGVGQKASGYMANISYRAVMEVIEALADGSLYTTGTARADALEVAPDSASLFWKCVVARPYTLDNYNFCREKLGLNPVSTLPPFPFEPGKPGPGEILDAELAAELATLDTE